MKNILWLACAVALGACSSHSAGGGGQADLTIAQQREPRSLNPALENGTASTQWGLLLFSYLLKYDDRGHFSGDVATQVPSVANGGISADGKTITYHLRKDVRFADGTPLTAQDCVWSIDAINNRANNVQSRYGYDLIARAQAPNDTTLVLHLKKPFAPLLTIVLAPQGFPILPKHILQKEANFNDIAFNSAPIGSGPFVVTHWTRGDRVSLRANPYYRPAKPGIARLDIAFVPSSQTAINLLHTHEIGGYFSELDYADYPILRGIGGYRVTSTPQNAVGALIFNTRDPVTSDARVRHALAQAIDIKTLIRKAYRGGIDTSRAGRGLFIWAYDPVAYPDIPFDVAGARRLLDAAGWKLDGAVRRKDGHPLSVQLIIQAATPGDASIASNIVQYERAIGVEVTIKQFNVTQFVAPAGEGGPVYGGKFQMALYPFVNGDDPDTTDQFACANVPPNGYNKSRICDPAIDTLLDRGRVTYDPAMRKAVYGKLQALLYRELPIALLYQRPEMDTFTTKLHGQTTSLSGAFWNAGAWTI